ncbi:hypothetical protein ACOMHN_000678 [Nucella lapillus]
MGRTVVRWAGGPQCWRERLDSRWWGYPTQGQTLLTPVRPVVAVKPETLKAASLRDLVDGVDVLCTTPSPPDDRIKSLISLTIERSLEEPRPNINNPQVLATATTKKVDGADTQIVATGGRANWTVRGGVTLISAEASVGILIRRSGCWDAGQYICRLEYYTDTAKNNAATARDSRYLSGQFDTPCTSQVSYSLYLSGQLDTPCTSQVSDYLYLSVNPTELIVNVTPSFASVKMEAGTLVNITCSGNVGSIRRDDYEIQWVWEFQDRSTASKMWKEYDGDKKNITEPFFKKKESCFERRYTKLSRLLTKDDSTRDYRCYLRRRHGPGDFVNFLDTAQVVIIPDFLKASRVTLGKVGTVGIVFGVIALLCAISFTCFFYRRRHRRMMARDEEVAMRKYTVDEKRKSLATVMEKRKSLQVGEKPDGKLDNLLNRLEPAPKPPASSMVNSQLDEESTFAEESSMVESSMAESSTAAASEA